MARATLIVDTGYVIALVSPRDRFHAAAVEWAGRIKRDKILLVTSRAVQLEFGAALSRTPHRAIAIDLLDEMERDPGRQDPSRRPCPRPSLRARRLFACDQAPRTTANAIKSCVGHHA